MKALIFSLVLVVGSMAQASFYQESCSNPKGDITLANGHVGNYLKVTKVDYEDRGPDGRPTKEIIDIMRDKNISYQSDEVSVVEDISSGGCEQPGRGFYSSDLTTVKKLIITKVDGGDFDKDISGVSTDGKTIETFMICHMHRNSMAFCPLPEQEATFE